MDEKMHIPEGVVTGPVPGSPRRLLLIAIITMGVSLVAIAALFLSIYRSTPSAENTEIPSTTNNHKQPTVANRLAELGSSSPQANLDTLHSRQKELQTPTPSPAKIATTSTEKAIDARLLELSPKQ